MTPEPADDYLWDRSGEPDETLRRLEALLERFRYRPADRSGGENPGATLPDDQSGTP